jgi:uncharacterized protein (DUF362 family)/Pyruvate/2-oxoacid:ferredoxin oxidoreductase delta subunit
LGGAKKFVSRGDKVLLKPNLLSAHLPERAVTTHPTFIKGVARIVLEAGGIPTIGDSPALASLRRVAKKSGVTQVAEELGIEFSEFSDSVIIFHRENHLYTKIEIARSVLEVDKVINLPKIKTHSLMLLTLGVKNMFGCVVGKRKAIWHLEAGMNRDAFATMLLEIHDRVNPVLTLVDGIIGMEGYGPSRGNPRYLGIILGGEDSVAIDRVIAEILQISSGLIPTTRVATEREYGETNLGKIDVKGEKITDVLVKHYKLPQGAALEMFRFPLSGLIRNLFTSMPISNSKKCTLCKNCVDICPTGSMVLNGKKLQVDYSKCIRCFCCQEICPEGAIEIKYGYFNRLVKNH